MEIVITPSIAKQIFGGGSGGGTEPTEKTAQAKIITVPRFGG